MPFKSVGCSTHSNLSALTQLLNGCALASVWVFFEHLDRLPLVGLSILLKEIQLIHEQQIVTNFEQAVEKNMMSKETQQMLDFEEKPPRVHIGIFASI